MLHRLSTKLLASNLAPPIVGRVLKFNVASRLFIQTIYMYVCESVPLSGRQAGEKRTRLTRFNPGCSGLQPEIRSTQFSEDQMPLSKELMHVVAGIISPSKDFNNYLGFYD